VHTGAEVTGVKEAGDQVSVTYRTAQGPRQAAAELLVAADGIHSTAPRLLWPEAPPPLLRTLAPSWRHAMLTRVRYFLRVIGIS
jgi:2-polyprenyl-6-methoxyphenol hydroxylase-like FAD-dependent oxidoreductase